MSAKVRWREGREAVRAVRARRKRHPIDTALTWAASSTPVRASSVTVAGWPTRILLMSDSLKATVIVRDCALTISMKPEVLDDEDEADVAEEAPPPRLPEPLVPEKTTFVEGGLPGFEVVQWFGVFGPARLPSPIVRKLNATLGRALAAPEFREHFAAQGVELQHSSPAEFSNYVSAELVRWTRALKEMGINAAP